jgi:general secretion pathway protein A
MFTSHFKMASQPFLERTPVEKTLRDERVQEGLARLEYFAQAGSLALLTGPTGVGKSSLIQLFLHALSRHLYQPLYLDLTPVGATGLLKLLVTRLGETPKRGKERLFLQILEKTEQTDLTTLLIIDEAHLLEPQALTDLRILASSALDGDRERLKILLSGQEPLRDQLKRSSHSDLLHRIRVRYHLPPLTREQSASYLDSQMRTAGASLKVFEPEAKDLIHDYASGLPRQINNIATACLITAAAENLQKIGADLVNRTMADFRLP